MYILTVKKNIYNKKNVVIVHRRTEHESKEYGGYAIEIALKEFEDIMTPVTVFTPKLRDSEDEEYGFDI